MQINKKISIIAVLLVLGLVGVVGSYWYCLNFGVKQDAPSAHQDISHPPLTLNIKEGDTISSPVSISGSISGSWFFEGNLPLRLEDDEQRVISNGHAQAQGDWMTTEPVAFEGSIEYKVIRDMDGFVVIAKDNPSGLPENDDEIRIPVHIKAQAQPTSQAVDGCVVTGCSGQICSDEETVSTCEYTETYACYKTAQCARQSDGKCGWTMTSELKVCLGNSR